MTLPKFKTKAKVKCTYRNTALSVPTQLVPKGDMRSCGVLSVIVKTPEMHIPPWYWFRTVFSGAGPIFPPCLAS